MRGLALVIALVVPAVVVSAAPGSSGDVFDPGLSAITAKFVPDKRETDYSASIRSTSEPQKGSWTWSLAAPANDTGCNKFDTDGVAKKGADDTHWQVTAVWHHADTDGCSHAGAQHEGTVSLKVTLPDETCAASIFGTEDAVGPPADCISTRRCADELAAVARTRAKLKALKEEYDRVESRLQLLDGFAKLANGPKTAAKLDALKAKAKDDPAAAKELAETRRQMTTLLADIFKLRGDLEQLDSDIEDAEQAVKDAEANLAACQRSRFAQAARATDSCDDQASALGDAQGRRDAYADVRQRVPKRLVTQLGAHQASLSAGLKALARDLPAARATVSSLTGSVARAGTGGARLRAWSSQLDSKLATAGRQATDAANALTACQASG